MLFVVKERHGRGWDTSRGLRDQRLWDDHARFMDALVDDGFVRLGGPLHDGALMIVEAETADAVRARLAADPWAATDQLSVEWLEPWEILLGELPAH